MTETAAQLLPDLINAALECIDERVETVTRNKHGFYTEEDAESIQRERQIIERQIEQLGRLLQAAQAIASMRAPSVEQILRRRGFGFEADRIANLVRIVDALDKERQP